MSEEKTPEVLDTAAASWNDGVRKEVHALLLKNGEWVLVWVTGENDSRKQTSVKLSPMAALATMEAIRNVVHKTKKPLGWNPMISEKTNNTITFPIKRSVSLIGLHASRSARIAE